MNQEIVISFLHNPEQTKNNIVKCFSDNLNFFKLRGVDSGDALVEVIEWRYKIGGDDNEKSRIKQIYITSGFSVNWIDMTFTGFVVVCEGKEKSSKVFGDNDTLGIAFLLGFVLQNKHIDDDIDFLNGVCEILMSYGFKGAKTKSLESQANNNFHTHPLSSDEVIITLYKDVIMENISYLYVKTTSILSPYDYDDTHKIENVNCTSLVQKMNDIIRKISLYCLDKLDVYNPNETITDEDIEINSDTVSLAAFVPIWRTCFNNITKDGNEYKFWNNCYDHSKTAMPCVMLRPSDHALYIMASKKVYDDNDTFSDNLQLEHDILLSVSKDRYIGLAYAPLTTSALNLAPFEQQQQRQQVEEKAKNDNRKNASSNIIVIAREKKIRYVGNLITTCPTRECLEKFENSIVYADKPNSEKGHVYCAKQIVSLIHIPQHKIYKMSYQNFLAFHVKIGSEKCAVPMAEIGLVVYCLFRLRKNNKTFHSVEASDDFLVFNMDDLRFGTVEQLANMKKVDMEKRTKILTVVSNLITFAMDHETDDIESLEAINKMIHGLRLIDKK